MTQKKKINNSIMQPEKPIKASEYYTTFFSWRSKPVSDQFLDHLAGELLEWAIKDDDALKIGVFLRSKGLTFDDIPRWRERNKKFDAAYKTAIAAIGDRREMGAIKNKYNAMIVGRTLHHYDEDYRKTEEWHAKLKDEAQQGPSTFNITLPAIPQTEIVTERVKRNKTRKEEL